MPVVHGRTPINKMNFLKCCFCKKNGKFAICNFKCEIFIVYLNDEHINPLAFRSWSLQKNMSFIKEISIEYMKILAGTIIVRETNTRVMQYTNVNGPFFCFERNENATHLAQTKRCCLDMNLYIGVVNKSGDSYSAAHTFEGGSKIQNEQTKTTRFRFVCESATQFERQLFHRQQKKNRQR